MSETKNQHCNEIIVRAIHDCEENFIQAQLVLALGPSVSVTLNSVANGTVDQMFAVSLQALDQFGNVAVTEQRSITVAATGAATFMNAGLWSGIFMVSRMYV